jgi:hypothetical protein
VELAHNFSFAHGIGDEHASLPSGDLALERNPDDQAWVDDQPVLHDAPFTKELGVASRPRISLVAVRTVAMPYRLLKRAEDHG